MALPPPKPSLGNKRNNVVAYGGGSGTIKQKAKVKNNNSNNINNNNNNNNSNNYFSGFTFKPVNMGAYYNASGGCIAGDCFAVMADNSLKLIKNLQSGDELFGNCQIVCVVRMKCKDSRIKLSHLANGLKITPWHPVKYNNKWVFPNEIQEAKMVEDCDYVYNFVLNNKHSMVVNGIECVTLGHGGNDRVLKHEYFGNLKKIVGDLGKINGWDNGLIDVTSSAFKRDANNLVNRIVQ